MLTSSMMMRLIIRAEAQCSRNLTLKSSSSCFAVLSSLSNRKSGDVASLNFARVPFTIVRPLSTQGKDDGNANKDSQHDTPPRQNLTTKERMKIISTQYGAFGMAFHIAISLASLGMFYFLVYSGVDFTAFMTWIGMQDSKIATGASTFVVAYAVHKVFAPVRIGITFVSVPVLVRHFRKIGFFKK